MCYHEFSKNVIPSISKAICSWLTFCSSSLMMFGVSVGYSSPNTMTGMSTMVTREINGEAYGTAHIAHDGGGCGNSELA